MSVSISIKDCTRIPFINRDNDVVIGKDVLPVRPTLYGGVVDKITPFGVGEICEEIRVEEVHLLFRNL